MTNPKPPSTSPGADSSLTLAAIAPIARSSVVDAVADRLRGEILSGRIAAGAKLPSERELSLALGVNRLTLRASLARLEALGLISTRHGAGTVVTSWRERAGLDALATLIGSLTPADAGWSELATSILEIRRILACEAIALAAARHTQADLDAIVACQKTLLDLTHDPLAYARADVSFMRAVVRAAHNIGLELLLNTFARFPDENPVLVQALYDRPSDSVYVYEIVVALIRTRNADAARTTVRRALEEMDVEWTKRHVADATPHASARASKDAAVTSGGPKSDSKKKKRSK
jgi:DNA-binding FadR family transcriptional regulator